MRGCFTHDLPQGPLRFGIGGPVGAGKTTLTALFCQRMRAQFSLAAVTNDICTGEDTEALMRLQALPRDLVIEVETGGCPHAAIREDASIYLAANAGLNSRHPDADVVQIDSGGDNLSATLSPELVDLAICVIDVGAGEETPRKGGPVITRADILVRNKTDPAPYVGFSLRVTRRDSLAMPGRRPLVSASLKSGDGPDPISRHIADLGGLLARPG